MMFDYYNSIVEVIPYKKVSIEQALGIIKSDTFKHQINNIRNSNDRTKLKQQLPCFTFSGMFKSRSITNLIKASGILVLDIDHIKTDETLKKSITSNEYTYFLFKSPSGEGFKLGVKIPVVENDTEFKTFWSAIAKHFSSVQADPHAKDISRACFVSYDPDLYYNPDSKVFTEFEKPQNFDTIDNTQTIPSSIIDIIVPRWLEGKRQYLSLYLVAFLRQKGYGINSITQTIKSIMYKANDTDTNERLNSIKTTFEKNEFEIKGYSGLKELLSPSTLDAISLALNDTIRKPKKEYQLYNITSHIPLYNTLSNALGLYGERYEQLKKLMWYSLLGNAIKESNHIDYCGTKFDTRENVAIFASSGSGKNDINRVYMDSIPLIHESSDITSLHPEQLIGKVITTKNKITNQKVKVPVKGYFDDDIIVMDESRDFFLPTTNNLQKQQFNELRKYFCVALNPIGTNQITKRLTEHTRDDALKYYPKCTCCFLSQPVQISSDAISSGFMRRFTFIEIKGHGERDEIYKQRIKGISKTPFTGDLSNFFSNMNIDVQPWVFENIGESVVKYAGLLCDYGISYSEKSAAFIKEIYEQSMYDKLLKYSVLVAVTRTGAKKVTSQDVQIAYMELFEILTGTFECLNNHADDFEYSGMKYNDLLILRWLNKRNAISKLKSTITVDTLCKTIADIYNVKERQAVNYYNKLKDKELVDIYHGKTTAIVVLSDKSKEILRLDETIVTTDFYDEYVKICEELKNETNKNN